MQIIAIVNQKGGVGKSTTAMQTIAGLTDKGYKVLGVDLDSQCNLSDTMGARTDGKTSFSMMLKENTAYETIQSTPSGDIIPGSKALATLDQALRSKTIIYPQNILKDALEPIKANYDYVVIDTPPALGTQIVNALVCCDKVVIPAQADLYSLNGIDELNETIKAVKEVKPNLVIAGILLTRYDNRNNLTKDITTMANRYADAMGTKVFNAKIHEAVAVKESQVMKTSLFDYAPKHRVTNDYRQYIEELLKA